jgi:uncharacterized membrane protein YhiD involved in acid resistance
MLEWLQVSFKHEQNLDQQLLGAQATQLAVAFFWGLIVGGIYRVTTGNHRSQSSGMVATLVLLTILIGMVTLVIGNSVARAFSLVGALAIVRFRTIVEDTRDTAFVICAVAVGMASGAGFLMIPLIGMPFVAVAAWLFRPRDPALGRDFNLIVRVGTGRSPSELFTDLFNKHLDRSHLTAIVTARQGAAIDLTYGVRLRQPDGLVPLVAELNALEGVQNVELRQRG